MFCDATSVEALARGRELQQWQHCECAKPRGSADSARFETDPVMNSHGFTWQKASLKDTNEDNKRCLGECRLNTESRGSDRVVASSDGHEIRLDDD